MSGPIRRIIYYRAAEELRRVLYRGSGVFDKLKFSLFVLTPCFLFLSLLKICSIIFAFFELRASGDKSVLLWHYSAGMLFVSLLIFGITFFELLREIGFSQDRELLATAPLSARQLIGYRLCFACLRAAPFSIAFLSFPLGFVWFFLRHDGSLAYWVLVIMVYTIWVTLFALISACTALAGSNRWNISPHCLFFLLYMSFIGLCTLLCFNLPGQEGWNSFVGHYRAYSYPLPFFPHHQIAQAMLFHNESDVSGFIAWSSWFFLTTILSGAAFFFATLRLWRQASRPVAAGKDTPQFPWIFKQRTMLARSRPGAILQKDVKDLFRNPVHRYSLLGILVLLPIGMWGQAVRQSHVDLIALGSPSKAMMVYSLNLLYLVPLLFSGRTVSLEFRMLDFYALALPRMSQLLEVKLRAQVIVNCLITIIAAVPFFLFLQPGPRLLEVVFFLGAVVFVVPVLTALAIALGTFFPKFSDLLEPFGIRPVGMVLYFAMTIPLYSLLLDLYGSFLKGDAQPALWFATSLVGLLVTFVTLRLFARARHKISLLVSLYPGGEGRS